MLLIGDHVLHHTEFSNGKELDESYVGEKQELSCLSFRIEHSNAVE